ncbi:MAG TPA: hypothetical protein VFY28_02065 [Candidatus Paceibacterota bacterium]|nr:hypothetical protein [Candidatus Paceibacterota bacterium]
MQKNILIAIGVLVLVGVGGYFLLTRYTPQEDILGEEQASENDMGNDRALAGPILEINADQIAADGPYEVTIMTSAGEEAVIAIPSMGLPLCAARENIADLATVSVGETIEVRGALMEDGTIVPCDSPEHYFRTAKEQKG